MSSKAIDVDALVDSLYPLVERLKAASYLYQDIEQKVHTTRLSISEVGDERATKEVAEFYLEEVASYVFMLGEMVIDARSGVEGLYRQAKAEVSY